MGNTHVDLALELYEVAAAIQNSTHMREVLKGRNVSTVASKCEQGRTLEIQLLDDDGELIDFAVFSDGPSGSFGVGGVASREGVRLECPKLYMNGVPVRDIDITLSGQ